MDFIDKTTDKIYTLIVWYFIGGMYQTYVSLKVGLQYSDMMNLLLMMLSIVIFEVEYFLLDFLPKKSLSLIQPTV